MELKPKKEKLSVVQHAARSTMERFGLKDITSRVA